MKRFFVNIILFIIQREDNYSTYCLYLSFEARLSPMIAPLHVEVKVETSVSVYRDKPIALFSIVYTGGLTDASIPNTSSQTLSTFPSFVIEEKAEMNRGYLTWCKGRKYCRACNCCVKIVRLLVNDVANHFICSPNNIFNI